MTGGLWIVATFVVVVLAVAALPPRRRRSETATAGPFREPAVLAHSSALTEEGDRC